VSSAEVDIELAVCRYAEAFGAVALKLNVQGRRGWPDRMILFPKGQLLFIEFKRPGEKPAPIQKEVHAQLRRFGFDIAVIDSTDKGIAAVDAARSASGGVLGVGRKHTKR
jgi:hypothetical protein